MEPAQAQQDVIQRITQANNILVTVSANPSVDQLASAIGLTLLLNRLDKHATAVFSGKVPSTIEFLEPEKTLEHNTDSLRDFIISLDKNKADKLRYKVEDQFVRIYITPYKTSISQKDLVFSEGDFNVELVLALGVRSRSELDAAIAAQGRILHDATTVSMFAGKPAAKTPDLGQINIVDEQASSLSEMVASMSDSLGENLLDKQMATSFLTGIVSETHRFSNAKTTPKALSVSAKLMSAGANQQLIVSKLEPPPPPSAPPAAGPRQPKTPPPAPPQPAGQLSVSHHPAVANTPEVKVDSDEIRIDKEGNITSPQNKTMLPTVPLTPVIPAAPTPAPTPNVMPAVTPLMPTPPALSRPVMADNTPTVATGTHQLLDPGAQGPAINTPFTADTEPGWSDSGQTLAQDALMGGQKPGEKIIARPGDTPPPVDNARSAVDQAIAAAPFDPAGHPLQAMNSTPVVQEIHPPQPPLPQLPNSAPKAAPPPVPPPLTAPNGAVLPTPPQTQAQASTAPKA